MSTSLALRQPRRLPVVLDATAEMFRVRAGWAATATNITQTTSLLGVSWRMGTVEAADGIGVRA